MDHKLEDHCQDGVEIEDVGERALLREGCQGLGETKMTFVYKLILTMEYLTFDLDMNRKQPAKRKPWIVACLNREYHHEQDPTPDPPSLVFTEG